MAELVAHREKFLVRAQGSVEVRVTFLAEQASGKVAYDAWYECTTCEERMLWKGELRHWECVGCGYSMTAAEAVLLCDHHIKIVEMLQSLTGKRKGLLWRLWRLFGGGPKVEIESPI